MKRLMAIAICAFAPVCMFGQVFRTDPLPSSTIGYAPPTAYPPVLAIPGAAIALCNDAACATRTTTYTSAAGTSSCPSTAQVVLAGTVSCTATSDRRGNFGFWVNSGTYYYTITVGGTQYGPYPLSVGGSSGGGGNVSGNGTQNFTSRWLNTNTLGIGALQDNGLQVGVGGAPDQLLTMTSSGPSSVFHIVNSNQNGFGAIRFKNDTGTDVFTMSLNGSTGGGYPQFTYSQPLSFFPAGRDTIIVNSAGNGDLFRIYGTGGFNIAGTAALSTPSANYGKLWFDATNLTFQAINQSGSVSSMVFPKTCGTGNVVSGVDATGNLSCVASGTGGTVTSVGLSLPGIFSVTGSPVTGSGVLTGTFINQTANTALLGPASGSPGPPGFRSMVLADLPSIASTNLSDSSTLVRNNTSNTYTTGSQDFSNASHLVAKNGLSAAKPATCAVGEVYFATDASAGQNWYYCTAVNTWSPQAAGGTVNTSGTISTGRLALFSGPTSITNSLLQDNGVQVSIGAPLINDQLSVTWAASSGTIVGLKNLTSTAFSKLQLLDDSSGQMSLGVNNTSNTGGHVGFLAATGLGGINISTDTGDYVFQNHAANGDMFRIYGTGGFVTVPVAGPPGGAPASGFGKFWFDSTAQTLQGSNSTGQTSTMVFPNACAGQVVQSISSAGVITCGAGGGGGGTASVPTVSISGATATFFPNCSAGCNASEGGNQVQNFTATNTATAPASSTGSLYVFWAGTSGCQAILSGSGSAVTLAGSGPCSGITSTSGSGFPNNATALISRVDYNTGTWTGFVNYQPTAANPPVITTGTGITQTLSPGVQQISVDTSAASIGTGTANNVARWSGNAYTLATGMLFDDGTKAGVGGLPDSGYAFQVVGNTTGALYSGVSNRDATNSGTAQQCMLVNGASAYTCMFQLGSANGNTYNFTGTAVKYTYSADLQIASQTSTCSSTEGGRFNYHHTNGTTKDVVQVCAQDASGTYAWRAIY